MIRELCALFFAFGLFIFGPKGKLWPGARLMIAAAVMGVGAGLPASVIAGNFTKIVTTPATLKTIAVIVQIGILSALMKHYNVLDGIVGALRQIFTSAKAVITILPAAIGLLSVPGGAGISSPFVDELGASMGLSVQKRAAINLTFRHMSSFLFPTSASLIVFCALAPRVGMYRMIAVNVPFVVLMELTAYRLYVRDAPAGTPERGSRLAGLAGAAVYLSPVYTVVVLNALLGVPLYLSVFCSLLLILAAWGRRDPVEWARVFWQGLSFKTLVMMLGIYSIQNTVRSLSGIMAGFSDVFANTSGFSVLLLIAAAALLFGLTTGLSYVSLGVLVPLVLGLNLPPAEELLYCGFIYAWSFNSYFFSPLHLCQVLTVQQMDCPLSRLERSYVPLMAEMAVSTFVIFYAGRAALL